MLQLGLGGLGQGNVERFIGVLNEYASAKQIRPIDLAEPLYPSQSEVVAESMAALMDMIQPEVISDGQFRAVVFGLDGKPTRSADTVRRAVFRLSGGTGDVPKARFEEAVARSTERRTYRR